MDTDGSKEEEVTGAGVYSHKECKGPAIVMGRFITIIQAEMIGILAAALLAIQVYAETTV